MYLIDLLDILFKITFMPYLLYLFFTGKVAITVDVDMGDNVGRDGVRHWNIKNFKHTYDLKEKSTIELENLFNGNEVLGT